MLRGIKILLRDNPYTIAISITIAITILSLMHINAAPTAISFAHADKLKHALAYFVLTSSWFYALESSGRLPKGDRWVVLAVFSYGILMEFFQFQFTEERQADVFDVLANSFGIVFAALAYKRLVKLIRHTFA